MMQNILITGIGGQGTVLASRLIGDAALAKGMLVRGSETIGMAQRGGSVTSHLRIGDAADGGCGFSPLLGPGMADLLIAFELAEALRAASFLKQGGTMLVSDAVVQPHLGGSSAKSYYDPAACLAWLKANIPHLIIADSKAIIDAVGSRSLNVALLGLAVRNKALPFTLAEMEAAVRGRVKVQYVEHNLKALNF
jgi:indolepyruvate ferredoxin oxidoreductase beta subunit